MPHVEIKCFPGRTNNQKKLCAEKISEVIAETLGWKTSSVSVAIKDIPEEKWKEEVWDKSIIEEKEFLYKDPGYTWTWKSYKIKVSGHNKSPYPTTGQARCSTTSCYAHTCTVCLEKTWKKFALYYYYFYFLN